MKGSFALAPVRDAVAVGCDEFVASGAEPWLALTWPGLRRVAGVFVTISYRACLWDAPARPIFRFLRNGTVLAEVIGPAPLEVAAIWTGRVPAGTTHFHVSPTGRPGPFRFRIEAVQRRSWPQLLREGYGRAPRPARSALLTKLIGWGPEADHNLAWAIGAYPMEDYAAWSAQRSRPLEHDGLDRPRIDWNEAPQISIVVPAAGCETAALERTLDSLRQQRFPRWRALVISAPATPSLQDVRIASASASQAMETLLSDNSWFGVIPAGATLQNEALAIVAERRAREPDVQMVYGDELVGGQPVLKPGWSPHLAAALPVLGRAVFAAPSAIAPHALEHLLEGGDWPMPPEVTPLALRRILLARPARAEKPEPAKSPVASSRRFNKAAIIVLTRDQPLLLTRLAASIRSRTTPGTYRLVLVDNGDAGGPAAALLANLASAPDVEVLRRSGPFNFSAFCNEAVEVAGEEVLVFLNDDMEVLSDGWLERLVDYALEPGVGAVGARLTYPDGRLQHVGVVAGMGGSAGHFGAPAPGNDPGWAGRNAVTHEVSAVTGACLAVTREKFEAVGGFDAAHLPIELSDIDLCLKLNARGWQTIVAPDVHLMHEESFSRGGATFRRLSKYGDQRAVFMERWRHVLRDDPVFHPALSLYSWHAALG